MGCGLARDLVEQIGVISSYFTSQQPLTVANPTHFEACVSAYTGYSK